MWYDHKAAGQALNPPRSSSQSTFGPYPQDLTKWGYTVGYETGQRDVQLGEYYYGLQEMLAALGASRRKEDWVFWKITHGDYGPGLPPVDQQTYIANGYTYRVGIREGCIIGLESLMCF